MGKVMDTIFGGSKNTSQGTSESGNKAFDQIQGAFSPMFGLAGGAADNISRLLGGDSSGFDAYKDATGFNALTELGSRGITNNAAARGLLRSGGTGKSLVNYGQTMQNQYAQNYLNQLLGLGNMGFQAGNLVSGAGQYSQSQNTSSGKSKPGISKFIGAALAGEG